MQPVFLFIGEVFTSLDPAHTYRDYHVIQCQQGKEGLETLIQLKQRQIPVVLVCVEHQLEDLTGVDVLTQAWHLIPSCLRLLVSPPDAQASLGLLPFKIDAIVTRCVPPEEYLFPVIDALLEQYQHQPWTCSLSCPSDVIRVFGHRWSAESHKVKDFLARNGLPFQWIDLETSPDALRMVDAHADTTKLPMLLFPDGSSLMQPTTTQIALKMGLSTNGEKDFYDLIIIGGGPAGLAAAVYGASEGLRTLIIEREAPGGQAGMSSRIENYLGFPVGLSGSDLARRAVAQASRLGATILCPQEVIGIRIADPYRYVTLADSRELGCYALLLATGVSYRTLAIPGMDYLTGAGVYYGAAMTEAVLCQGKHVYIVGGANSAGQAALFCADYARQVTILVRGESLEESMSSYLIDEIHRRDTIDVQTQTEVTRCLGAERLEHLSLRHAATGEEEIVSADALFIFIGASPQTQWLPEAIARDQAGFVLAGTDVRNAQSRWALAREPFLLETSVPGIFVVGDVRAGSVKRVATAIGDGAVAVSLIHQYLRNVR